jgi:putative membrane protein
MKKIITIIAAAAATALLPQTSLADRLSSRDAKFIREAAEGNNAEIQMGQMVAQRTQDPQVRAYADKLVRDHTQANRELRQIAESRGIDMPQGPSRSDERSMRRMQAMNGRELDREAVDHWVKDHKKDIKEYDKEARRASDPQVKQYATMSLPTLRDHLSNAKTLSNRGRTIREPAGAFEQRWDWDRDKR